MTKHQTPQPKLLEEMVMSNDDAVADIRDVDKTNGKTKEDRNITKSAMSIFRCISLILFFLKTQGRS